MKKPIWNLLLIVLVCACLPGRSPAQTKPAADLVITNAKVWTGDKSLPAAQAVAVLGDRIVAVGSNADADMWRGPNTKVLDAAGSCCCPASMTRMSTLFPEDSNSTTYN